MSQNKLSLMIDAIQMSEHLPLDVEPKIGRKWVLNGEDNSFYQVIADAYDDSATNAAILNGFSQYVYAEGLIDSTNTVNVNKHISKKDTRLICKDYNIFGAYCIQIIWNSALKAEDKRPLKIEYYPVKNIGLNIDQNMEIDGYWYSFDWTQKNKYKPDFIPKFTGSFKGNNIEMLVVSQPSSRPFFAQPAYISALPYCRLEGELANYAYMTTQNGFQGSMVINFNNGEPENDDIKAEYDRQIKRTLGGTNNSGKFIIAYNKDASTAVTIEPIPSPERNELYISFGEIAESKIKTAHGAPPILFSGSQQGSGFSNNADEIVTATKALYRKEIYPRRETIIEDGLQLVFDLIDYRINLKFKDYDEFEEESYKNKEEI